MKKHVRDQAILVRVTRKERAAIQGKAEKARVSLSDFVRLMCLEGDLDVIAKSVKKEE